MTGTTSFDGIRKVLADSGTTGLADNVAGATAILLLLVGFGFKVAAVPFHQWAPDAYEGAPAPVTAWIATGSKLASFVAFMKVFLHALLPWSSPTTSIMGPGWIGIIAIISAVTMTYGNFAALAQRNLKRMLAYSSIAHAGYILVGVAAVSISMKGPSAAGVGAVLPDRLCIRQRRRIRRRRLAGPRPGQRQHRRLERPRLSRAAVGDVYPDSHAFTDRHSAAGRVSSASSTSSWKRSTRRNESQKVTLIWLVALGLMNSVVSAFYYVRVLKAMFLREPGTKTAGPARPRDLHADRAGNRRRGGLRLDARLADERDAGRRRADVDESDQALHSAEHTSAIETGRLRTEQQAAFHSVPIQ